MNGTLLGVRYGCVSIGVIKDDHSPNARGDHCLFHLLNEAVTPLYYLASILGHLFRSGGVQSEPISDGNVDDFPRRWENAAVWRKIDC